MKRAELIVTMSGWSQAVHHHLIAFESAEQAEAEFEKIAALLKKRGEKGNDIPKWLDIQGINKLSCEFDHIAAIGWVDLKKQDEAETGLRDEFPHINWKN